MEANELNVACQIALKSISYNYITRLCGEENNMHKKEQEKYIKNMTRISIENELAQMN